MDKIYRVSLNLPDIKERFVTGKKIKLVDYIQTFYYHSIDDDLYVVCELTTGMSIGYGETLKRAKTMALETLEGRTVEAVLKAISNLPHLNEA